LDLTIQKMIVIVDCAIQFWVAPPAIQFWSPLSRTVPSEGDAPMPFTDKTALVTGSTTGIGARVARLLAAQGADVVVSGRNAERGDAIVQEITAAGGRARFVPAELADLTSVRALAEEAGDVHVLVNNAAIFPMAPTVDQDDTSFEAAFAVNVRAPFFLTAALAPGMVDRGSGAIVNVSTMAAQVGMAGLAVYSATKAALDSLTRTWTAELAGSGVRVNSVSPGPTATEMSVSMGEEVLAQIAATTAMGRLADPAEIARAIAFVASDEASYITGAILAADGGRTAI
jgi:NAD(P)-dependent dehydrogenase (short-subunit alcohol dehydrogenase family)